jgi:hypothetical protein
MQTVVGGWIWKDDPANAWIFRSFRTSPVFHGREVAETEGFEPSIRVIPVWRFSKPLVSATHPRLRFAAAGGL